MTDETNCPHCINSDREGGNKAPINHFGLRLLGDGNVRRETTFLKCDPLVLSSVFEGNPDFITSGAQYLEPRPR